MGMTITIFWKLFSYGVKKEHYEKLSGIRELFEQLSLDCFNNKFSNDTGTLAKNIPLLDGVDGGDTVYTCRALHFSSSVFPSTEFSTISDTALISASFLAYTLVISTIGYQHTAKKEESR